MKFYEDTEYQESVLKKFDSLSRNTKLYESQNFMRFLRKISSTENALVLSYFLYILHNLIRISERPGNEFHVKLISDHRKLLLCLFASYNEKSKRCYSHVNNILQTIGLDEQEWSKVHWKRILNAISGGISAEQIVVVYENIVFVRNR